MIKYISMALKISKFFLFILLLNGALVFADQASVKETPTFTDKKTILQLYQLMKDTHEILTAKKILYWVAAGTLLGAVRHQGIIPWDDDLDICIDTKDTHIFFDLKPLFKKLGYDVVSWGSGFKIFFENGPKVYSKIENGVERYYKFPFIDIFRHEQKGNDIVYGWEWFREPRNSRYVAIYADELFPLRNYKFGSFLVKGPNKPLDYLKCCYGRDCIDSADYGASHGNAENIKKGTITLGKKDKKPALPIGPLRDRVLPMLENQDFSLDVITVGRGNLDQSQLFLKSLQPIFVEAFAKQTDAQLKKEHLEEYKALKVAKLTIKDVLVSRFNKIIEVFLSQLGTVNAAYIVTLKDNKTHGLVGYAILTQAPIAKTLQSMISRGYIESVLSLSQDLFKKKNKFGVDVYVLSVAVLPSYHKRGLGKRLIHSIFLNVPKAKSIYLITAASKTNVDVQQFYKHLNFKKKGLFLTNDKNKKILYSLDAKKSKR